MNITAKARRFRHLATPAQWNRYADKCGLTRRPNYDADLEFAFRITRVPVELVASKSGTNLVRKQA